MGALSYFLHSPCTFRLLCFHANARSHTVVRGINGFDHHRVFPPDGISNGDFEDEEEKDDPWEDNDESRTTSVKFTDDVENEKTKEVGFAAEFLFHLAILVLLLGLSLTNRKICLYSVLLKIRRLCLREKRGFGSNKNDSDLTKCAVKSAVCFGWSSWMKRKVFVESVFFLIL